MMQYLANIDQQLFIWLNSGFAGNFFDWLMPLVTDFKTWAPLILLVWLGLLFSGRPGLRVLALTLVLSVVTTDVICGKILKKLSARRRPCALAQEIDFKCRLLLPMKTSSSMPSNHAANTAAFAVAVLARCGLRFAWPFLSISLLIGYSRIYVGVHFPFDVLAGWLLGSCFALLVCSLVQRRWPPATDECQPLPAPEKNQDVSSATS